MTEQEREEEMQGSAPAGFVRADFPDGSSRRIDVEERSRVRTLDEAIGVSRQMQMDQPMPEMVNPMARLGVNPQVLAMRRIADMNAMARAGSGYGAQGRRQRTIGGRRVEQPMAEINAVEAFENLNTILGVAGRDPSQARPVTDTEWTEMRPYLEQSPQGRLLVARYEGQAQAFDNQLQVAMANFNSMEDINAFLEENRDPLISGYQDRKIAEMLNEPAGRGSSPLQQRMAAFDQAQAEAEQQRIREEYVADRNAENMIAMGYSTEQARDPEAQRQFMANPVAPAWRFDEEGKVVSPRLTKEQREQMGRVIDARTQAQRVNEAAERFVRGEEVTEEEVASIPPELRAFHEQIMQDDFVRPPAADLPPAPPEGTALEDVEGQTRNAAEQAARDWTPDSNLGELVRDNLLASGIELDQNSYKVLFAEAIEMASFTLMEERLRPIREQLQENAAASMMQQDSALIGESERLDAYLGTSDTAKQLRMRVVQDYGSAAEFASAMAENALSGTELDRARVQIMMMEDNPMLAPVSETMRDFFGKARDIFAQGTADADAAQARLDEQRNLVMDDLVARGIDAAVRFEDGSAEPIFFADESYAEAWSEAATPAERERIKRDSDRRIANEAIQTERAEVRRRAQARGELFVFDGENTTSGHAFEQNWAGKRFANAYARGNEGERKEIVKQYGQYLSDQAEARDNAGTEIQRLRGGMIEIERFGTVQGVVSRFQGDRFASLGEQVMRPESLADWDSYKTRMVREFAEFPEELQRILDEVDKAEERWIEETSKELQLSVGWSEEDVADLLTRASQADMPAPEARRGRFTGDTGEAESERMFPGFARTGEAGDPRELSRTDARALRDAVIGRPEIRADRAGMRQPLVPNERFQLVAGGGVRVGDRTIPQEEGHRLMWIEDENGRIQVNNIPEDAVDDAEAMGFLPFGGR